MQLLLINYLDYRTDPNAITHKSVSPSSFFPWSMPKNFLASALIIHDKRKSDNSRGGVN